MLFEYIDFQRVVWKSELMVDRSSAEQMTINFDLSFPKIPCFALTLDVMDAADQHQNNLEKDVLKMRLDGSGQKLGAYKDIHLEDLKGKDYCGSCNGLKIQDEAGRLICCNSCSAVFAAHEHMGVPSPRMEDIEQCQLENWPDLIRNHAQEGCRMSGTFKVNKVNGNFHFAAGKSFDVRGRHLHDVRFLDGLRLDFAHTVHQLAFGEPHAHLKNPLDGLVVSPDAARSSNVHSYYVKVVATDFHHRNGKSLHTNQFSVTKNTHDTATQVPSMFVFYDISPMVVVYSEFKRSWASFLTGVCAIVGGIYTIAALIDTFVFHAERKLALKNALGKAT